MSVAFCVTCPEGAESWLRSVISASGQDITWGVAPEKMSAMATPAGVQSSGVREVFDISVQWIGEISTTRPTCLLCGGRDATPLNTFVLNGRRFYTVRCAGDGMMWLDPRPTEAFYERLYREHYHRVRKAGTDDPLLEQATLDVQSDDARLARAAVWRLDELEVLGARPPGRFLEVGFGAGHTLAEAQRRGWEVQGLETAPACVEAAAAKGIPAQTTPFLAFDPAGARYDVIAAYSVIEHVPDPAAWLRYARTLLKPEGLLMLRLPDTPDDGPCASLIAHLHHFNQATIRELLHRCGLQTVYFGSFSVWRPARYAGELPNMNVAARKRAQDGSAVDPR